MNITHGMKIHYLFSKLATSYVMCMNVSKFRILFLVERVACNRGDQKMERRLFLNLLCSLERGRGCLQGDSD